MKSVSLAVLTAFTLSAGPLLAAPGEPIRLWPKDAPGETGSIGEEKDTSGPKGGLVAGKPLIRLGNVSQPMITYFRPAREKDTGASVIICPGG